MKSIFLITLLCMCIAFPTVEMRVHRVSSSSELSSALGNASPGDEIILEPHNYKGDYKMSVDGVTLSGKSGNNKDTVITGSTPITVAANHVTVQGIVLKGNVKAAGQQVSLKSLSIKGNVHLSSPRGTLQSTSVEGSVTIDSDGVQIQSNSVEDDLTLNGCNNVLRSNSYGKLHQTKGCPNDINVSNAVSTKSKSSCKWYHFYKSCFWG